MDRLAGVEANAKVELFDRDVLSHGAHQVHLDARRDVVPSRDVPKSVEIEAASELAVDPREKVLVERRGDAGGIVVGGQEQIHALSQIGAKQERGPGPEGFAKAAQKSRRFAVLQVADRA